MKFEESVSAQKGRIGEAIVDDWIRARGWVPYQPINGCKHPFDRLVASADKRKLCIVEVKTKPRREAYRDTGINRRHYDDYQHITAQYRMPLFLSFVDEREQLVYGNWWSVLVKPVNPDDVSAVAGMMCCGWNRGYPWEHNGIVYFQLSSMVPIAQLTPPQCEELRALRRTRWK